MSREKILTCTCLDLGLDLLQAHVVLPKLIKGSLNKGWGWENS